MARSLASLLLLVYLSVVCFGLTPDEIYNPPPIQSIAFVGTDTVWLVTGDGILQHTKDAGKSWNKLPSRTPTKYQHVFFIDQKIGWTIDEDAQVGRTTDGGKTWVTVAKLDYSFSPFVGPVEQIKFIDNLHGWIVDPFSIWRTEDGGVSWKRHVPLGGYNKKKRPTHHCFFLNPDTGWLFGEQGLIYRTNDGGQTWQEKAIQAAMDMDVSEGFFTDQRTGWACGWPNGGIYFTDDGGDSWRQQYVPGDGSGIHSVYFINRLEGWAVGHGRLENQEGVSGVILRTKDGGHTWQQVDIKDKEVFFTRVYFANSSRGWVTTQESIYRTDNGGRVWRKVLNLKNKSIEK